MADWFAENAPKSSPTAGGDWFARNAPGTATAAPEAPGYLSQVGSGLWNTVKGLAQFGAEAGGVATDPLNAIEHLKNLKKLAVDPQIDQAIQAAARWKAGDRSEAVGHALASVIPGFGPAAASVGEKLGSGDLKGAAADATVMGLTAAAPKIARGAIEAAPVIGAAAKGAGKGAVGAATEMVPFRRYGLPISAPKPIVTGSAAATAARMLGVPSELVPVAGIAGAAAPVVRGAVQGARAALADRFAAAMEASQLAERAATQSAPKQLPAPVDASAVHAVSATPPPPAPVKGLLGPGPDLIIPPAPAAPPDASFVKAVPAEYPTVEGAPKAPPVPDPTLLEGIAQGQLGKPFSKATQAEQQLIRNIASRIEQPTAPEEAPAAPRAAAPAPAPPVAAEPSAPGKTIQEMLREDLAARRPQSPAAESQAEPAAAPEKSVPVLDNPRSEFLANGERKSPRLRAAEITDANTEAKAERFAKALQGYVSSSELKFVPKGRVSPDQIAKGAVPGWANITEDLVSKGLLQADEVPPNTSIPRIAELLRQREQAASKAKVQPINSR